MRFRNFRSAYPALIAHVRKYGHDIEVQGGTPTTEVIGASLAIEDPRDVLAEGCRPGYNLAIGAAEATQLVAGTSEPALMVRISKNFERFMNGGTFWGAYGPRIRTQLPAVVDRLKSDSSSRQAIVEIWRPQDDLFGSARDLPCTLGFQFLLRDDRLHMVTRMRSWDLAWGVPYDVIQFATLQLTVANLLNVEVGHYHHHAGSLHLYHRDNETLDQVIDPGPQRWLSGFNGSSPQLAQENAQHVLDWVQGKQTKPQSWLIDDVFTDALARYRVET